MSASVTVEDEGVERLTELLQILKKLKVRVGFQGPEGKARHPDAPHLAVAHLAAIHEFGSDKVPEQAFIRGAIEKNAGAIEAFEEQQIQAAIDAVTSRGADPQRAAVAAMSQVGSFKLGLVKAGLTSNVSGTLRAAMSWRVSAGRTTYAKGFQ